MRNHQRRFNTTYYAVADAWTNKKHDEITRNKHKTTQLKHDWMTNKSQSNRKIWIYELLNDRAVMNHTKNWQTNNIYIYTHNHNTTLFANKKEAVGNLVHVVCDGAVLHVQLTPQLESVLLRSPWMYASQKGHYEWEFMNYVHAWMKKTTNL